ncbi:hypothetical protein [Halomonas denitrificans]|nr:hypothetical protein [Halomonas denitrificans]
MPDPASVRLRFETPEFAPDSGRLALRWTLALDGRTVPLEERFEFGPLPGPVAEERRNAVRAAIDALHWIAGVSYWKVACRGGVGFADRRPDPQTAELLEAVYRDGLAELAWRNELDAPWWPDFGSVAFDGPSPAPAPLGLSERALVPMGGGKDSLVALERLRRSGVPIETVQVGQAELIGRVARRTGLPHRRIGRRVDPALAELNAAGAINGHVPITAINAAALALAAVLWDFRYVVFANERSADEPTLRVGGRSVNHQWAKSLAFEAGFDDWMRRSVAADLRVFSILRRERELAVVREFASLKDYHAVFSSCNRNFHLDGARTDRWCGRCPKCLFVFLALAPFLSPDELRAIFGADLLADSGLVDGFAELLELDGHRPFECVGEAKEARAAVLALAGNPVWADHEVVRALAPRLDRRRTPSIEALSAPGGTHRIPEAFDALAPG